MERSRHGRSSCASLIGEAATDGVVEVERAARDLVAGAANDDGLAIALASAWWRQDLPMIGVDVFVVAAFERSMRGDENAVLEDANLVGEDVDVEDAATRRVRHAVEIAADAHHAFVRDAPFELQDCPIRRERQRVQRRPLLSKGFVDDALRGRVDAWVRDGVEPVAELRVEIIEVAERAAEEEVLADGGLSR